MTDRVTYEPGVYPDMPLEHYYADPCPGDCGSLNSGGIPYLRKRSPLHFATRSPVLSAKLQLEPAADMENAAVRRGRTVHRLALGKGDDFAVLDFPDFRTKAAQTARDDATAAGLTPMLAKDMAHTQAQADLVRAHLDEMLHGQPWLPEVALVWVEETPFGKVWCRALVDAWCPMLGVGVDLKSTTDASERQVTRRMEDGGYDIQAAWYSRGLNVAAGLDRPARFCTLFCETAPPHASQGFHLSEAWRTSAWDECQLALRTFAECQRDDRWPGYQRTARMLVPPPWLITRRMEAELNGGDLDDEPYEGSTDA